MRLMHFHGGTTAAGLFAIRFVAGAAMALHGWPKITNPTGWMGPDPGIPAPLIAAAAVAEFGGGICWMLGLLTPLFSLMLLGTMGTAAGMVHIPAGDPFVATKQGQGSWELAAVYFAVSLLLLLAGPGKFSLDYFLFGRRRAPST